MDLKGFLAVGGGEIFLARIEHLGRGVCLSERPIKWLGEIIRVTVSACIVLTIIARAVLWMWIISITDRNG